MKLPLVLSSLCLAATAYAQAPGDYAEPTGAPGMSEPVAVVVVAPPPRLRRWSVGLGIGSMSLAPHSAPDNETQFGVGQLALRFLATRHLEIELAVGGGREQLEDGSEGSREVSQGVLSLRYRFSPARRWNWWLMAGMGALAVTDKDASDKQRDDAQQSTLQFGVGLERRWSRFALQLEARAVGVKAHDLDDAPVAMPEPAVDVSMGGVRVDYDDAPRNAGDGMAGGQLVFSGNFYF